MRLTDGSSSTRSQKDEINEAPVLRCTRLATWRGGGLPVQVDSIAPVRTTYHHFYRFPGITARCIDVFCLGKKQIYKPVEVRCSLHRAK